MQLDYYRTPEERTASAPLPTGEGKPARRGRSKLPTALVLFLALILAFSAILGGLRLLSLSGVGRDWTPGAYLERFAQQFAQRFGLDGSDFDFSFDYGEPGDPFGEFDLPDSASGGQSAIPNATTIPRAQPDPSVQMTLSARPGRSLSLQEIYRKVLPSIVSVETYRDEGGFSGTGVVLTADGYVITNNHLVEGCSRAQVLLPDGGTYEAELVGRDAESDLAVLKIPAAGLTPAEFGDSDLLQVGDDVAAIGNPLGFELFGTFTEGIVSAINRDVNVDGYTMTLIQTTAALNPGNSGGALINQSGQVVGITNLKMMSSQDTIEGLGFAIPSTSVRDVVNVLLSQGAITGRPTIGIRCVTALPEYGYGRDSGVYVDSVTRGGPAEQAGVRPGDIIIEANGRTIADQDDLTAARDAAGVGGELKLTVWREGETLELTLVLVEQNDLS